MNDGASGFQEMQSSISRSQSYRFPDEQRHQFGAGSWQFLCTHDLIALSIDISRKRENVFATIFRISKLSSEAQQWGSSGHAPWKTQESWEPIRNGFRHSESMISDPHIWGTEKNRNSYPTRRAQMKVRRSVFTPAFVSLMFLGLFVLGIPVAGFAAGTPHTCPNGTHQAPSLGGVPTFTFVFVRDCPSQAPSGAIKWKAFVYDDTPNGVGKPALCSLSEIALPPYTQTVTCGPTLPAQVKVVISYKTSVLGAWMPHPELYTNP